MKKTIIKGVGVGTMVAVLSLPIISYVEVQGEEKVTHRNYVEESMKISPGLVLPEKEDHINKQVSKEDVRRTMNLYEISQSAKSALADIDTGIEEHLGYPIQELKKMQISLYEDNVKHYSKLVQEISETASTQTEIDSTLETFNKWVIEYKEEIDKYKEEEKAAEAQRLKDLEEQERLATEALENKQSVVNEVVGGLNGGTEIPNLDHISYGIPTLTDQHLTYMPYTAITAKTTPHYRLQQISTTDEDGYRVYQGARAVALGSAYGVEIGTLYDIEYSDGQVMRAILGDSKQDRHTDDKNQYRDARGVYDGKSGNIVEIIFDPTDYPDMNSINRKVNSDYPGEVISITKVGVAEGFGK